jgi:predicted transcriptional regulator
MATTTIRIEDDLKARVSAAAERAGKTPHAFIVDAIARTVEQAEIDLAFHDVAQARWARLLATGRTVGWPEARQYLAQRARGDSPPKPMGRKAR